MTTAVFEAIRLRRRRKRTGRGLGVAGTVAAVVVLLAVLAAILAPLLAPYDPTEVNFDYTYRPMESGAPLGTDGSGRDILSRLLYGARTSLLGPAVVVLVAAVVGTALALAAAIAGGGVDRVLSRIFDIGFAFPGLLLAILMVSVLGAGFGTAVFALAIAYIPFIGRIVRSVAVGEMALPYMSALVTVGQSRTRIATRHLLPAVMPTVLAQSTISFGYAMVDLAALSYLGLGVQPPESDWGLMVAEGQRGVLQGYWEEATFAGLAIVIVVAAVSLLGDRLADRISLNQEGR
ncbi:ABC transporter permease [Agromyces endophyticus]|uniref:ABC transporter permease n=1 Tax=Agromyces sp. H17E-10 TaxID=2932244 RepID=UPI001FD35310|nr:ABC transporter permease [Agromyces sp. H17E-10]UOQ87609.1 ABC transporter permease [Agromyces sp. H17E-10]